MAKHSILGMSQVASLWRDVYNETKVGSSIDPVIIRCGQPDEIVENENCVHRLLTYGVVLPENEGINLTGCTRYSWISDEWKGWMRGGWIKREMHFFVRDKTIIYFVGKNLDYHGW